MTSEERERLDFLCQQIVVEKDHQKFSELVDELNNLLKRKEKRLKQHRAS